MEYTRIFILIYRYITYYLDSTLRVTLFEVCFGSFCILQNIDICTYSVSLVNTVKNVIKSSGFEWESQKHRQKSKNVFRMILLSHLVTTCFDILPCVLLNYWTLRFVLFHVLVSGDRYSVNCTLRAMLDLVCYNITNISSSIDCSKGHRIMWSLYL